MLEGISARFACACVATICAVLLASTSALGATGAISGTMLASGKGVPGTVWVYEGESFDTEAFAGSEGAYSVSNLAEGSYHLEFFPDGNYFSEFYDEKPTLASADAVVVKGGETTSGIDSNLKAAGSIEGKVTDSSGSPLQDVDVYVYSTSGEFLNLGFTAEDGTYQVERLSSAEYLVAFKRFAIGGEQTVYYKDKSSQQTAEPVSVTAGSATTGVDEAMPALGKITGKVTDSEGHALSGVGIELLSGSNKEDEVKTAADGTYSIAGVLPGSYQVKFLPAQGTNYLAQYYNDVTSSSEAANVPVSSGATTAQINAALAKGAEITGTVKDTVAAPIAGVQVALYSTPGHTLLAETTTTAAGGYALAGLQSGSYLLEFAHAGYESSFYRAGTTLAAASAVSVTAGSVTSEINPLLAPESNATGGPSGGSASGQLTGVVSGPDGSPLQGAVVVLFDEAGRELGEAVTLANGTYTFAALASGSYRVQFEAGPAQNFAPQAYSGPVSVSEGELSYGIDAQMRTGGSIEGTVENEAGAPLAGIEVTVLRAGGATPQQVASAISAQNGTYSVGNLQSASYIVRFSNAFEATSDWITQFYNDQPSTQTADPVSVTEGSASTAINARLLTGARLSGSVSDQSSHPLAGVRVEVLDSEGNYVSGTNTESDGSYSVGNLPSGKYLVHFLAQGQNVLGQFYSAAATQQAAQLITLTAGSETAGVDAQLAPGSEISGSDGVENSHVSVLDTSGHLLMQVQAGGGGEYEVPGLPAGSYIVHFEPLDYQNAIGQYYKEASTFASATPLTISPTEPASAINASLAAGAQINGTVSSESGKSLSGVSVLAYDPQGHVVSRASSRSNGTYSVVALPAGSYRLEFRPPENSAYMTGYYEQQSSLAAATPLTLSNRQSINSINEKLATGGAIEGVVENEAGAAVAGVEVTVLEPSGAALAQSTSAANGSYSVSGLEPGSYDVEFQPPGPDELSEFYPGVLTLSEAQAVNVSAGAPTKEIDSTIKTFSEALTLTPPGGGSPSGGSQNSNPLNNPQAASVGSSSEASPSPSAGASAATNSLARYGGSKRALLAKGVLELELSCADTSACSGTLTLVVYLNKHGAVVSKPIKGGRTITLAHASYSLQSNAKRGFELHLSASAARLLASHPGGLSASLELAASGLKGTTITLKLARAPAKQAKTNRHKKHK